MIGFMNNFIRLENSNLLVLVDVNYGGKIVKLINKDNGSNWVWFNDSKYSKYSPTEFSDYDSQWIGGYEELYPNDKVELINGKQAPDHGELWSSSWEIINNTAKSLEIKCEGYFSNSMIIKKFEIIGNKLLVNCEIKEIKFKNYLFKLHLALPVNRHSVEFGFKSFKKVDHQFGNIVQDDNLNDFLTSINADEGRNDFVYFYGIDSEIKIFDQNNNVCILEYDKETLPYFWIFQSRGGWNNLNVNVLEPCNSGLKDIQTAVKNNLIYIPKDNNFHTWYTIELI
mgnify:CR=1 FL=1